MKKFLIQFFTWWNGQTIGTKFFTWRKGILVGKDQFGNKYYQEKKGKRRWVIFNGLSEASMIPPGWHGWMHHRIDVPPTKEEYVAKPWQKEHLGNQTGTPQAYHPPGSILTPENRPKVTGDYDAWTPK